MAKTPKQRPADDMPQGDDGLVNDEYSDDSLEEVNSLDALDVPSALQDDSVLNEMADDSDGIEELDVLAREANPRVDDGGNRRHNIDDAEMGLGAEPHSTDELADAAIGHELRGRQAVTRDDQVHGERLFDNPNTA